jgi:hypothetical protein
MEEVEEREEQTALLDNVTTTGLRANMRTVESNMYSADSRWKVCNSKIGGK